MGGERTAVVGDPSYEIDRMTEVAGRRGAWVSHVAGTRVRTSRDRRSGTVEDRPCGVGGVAE
ncbi:hypothetical protein GCM10010350_75880 [Streptomyces galilaeus]|nr:hypothetical protein GCM10010350_75880 [Streptomyces galilaeus]